jgi:hypothetical protein
MRLLPGENDSAGLSVTVCEGGRVSKKGKMSHRDNISQFGKTYVVKLMGKTSQSERFVTIQVKKVGRFVTATLRPPTGLGGGKIPGRFVFRRNVTVDVTLDRRILGDITLLGRSELGHFIKAPFSTFFRPTIVARVAVAIAGWWAVSLFYHIV